MSDTPHEVHLALADFDRRRRTDGLLLRGYSLCSTLYGAKELKKELAFLSAISAVLRKRSMRPGLTR